MEPKIRFLTSSVTRKRARLWFPSSHHRLGQVQLRCLRASCVRDELHTSPAASLPVGLCVTEEPPGHVTAAWHADWTGGATAMPSFSI